MTSAAVGVFIGPCVDVCACVTVCVGCNIAPSVTQSAADRQEFVAPHTIFPPVHFPLLFGASPTIRVGVAETGAVVPLPPVGEVPAGAWVSVCVGCKIAPSVTQSAADRQEFVAPHTIFPPVHFPLLFGASPTIRVGVAETGAVVPLPPVGEVPAGAWVSVCVGCKIWPSDTHAAADIQESVAPHKTCPVPHFPLPFGASPTTNVGATYVDGL